MKRMSALLFIAISLVGLSSCLFKIENPYPYCGEYRELYTAAIYSIPDAEGYMHHGEGAYNADIYVWEQDDYGRTLFSYCEDYGNQIFGLVIAQAYEEGNVYFYPDVNYALTFIDSECLYEGVKDDHLKNKTEELYMEKKDKLKDKNDWNKPLDKSKCVSYPITNHKILGKNTYSLSSAECNEILIEYMRTLNLPIYKNSLHSYNSILQVDSEGRILHEIFGDYQHRRIILWVITDKDGNYDNEDGVMVLYFQGSEPYDGFIYNAEDVLEFKKKNGWKN